MKRPRRYFIETWGCQMNELDSQRMAGQLMQQGILPTRKADEADLILLNSCSIREKAEQKVLSRIGQYRKFKNDRPDLLIGLCGCVAQQLGQSALNRVPDLDFVLGPARVGELGEVLSRRRAGERVTAVGFPEKRAYELDAISREDQYKGMVTIIEGCDKKCTFCIVPQTRGPERCRTIDEILTEVRHLLDYGFLEIELLGQTVNHWKEPDGTLDFADLLDSIAALPGLERLRFVTSYPRDFSQEMVQAMGRHSNICPYLHLPVQAGANRTLRRMGRDYTIEEYRRLVDSLRLARPDLVLSTDIIVGFPGETDEEFQQTLDLLRDIRFSCVYAFNYSARPGTAAPRLGPAVDPEIAGPRLQELFALQQSIQMELNSGMEGQTFDVLVTGWGKRAGTQSGRTTCHRVVNFPYDSEPFDLGTITNVRIDRALPHSLLGQPT